MRAIDNMDDAIKAFLEIAPNTATKTELAEHTTNASNPHEVTKAQVGLSNVTNDRQATYADFTAHTSAVNPHGVTKSQVGLGDVDNVKQASKSEYNNHITGAADKHSGNDVMYSQSKSVNAKIDELIIEGGGGTMYHDELLNRNSENAHPIEAITGLYDKVAEAEMILPFSGTTMSDTPAYLTYDGEGIDVRGWIDEETGYLKPPLGEAAAVEIVILGFNTDNPNGYASVGGMYTAQALLLHTVTETAAAFKGGDFTAFKLNSEDACYVELGIASAGRLALMVVGSETKPMVWSAKVRFISIFGASDEE